MAKKLEYQITTDASKGIAGVKDFSSAVKKAMKDVENSTDDTTTNAQKLAKVYSKLADDLEVQFKGAAKAADALSQALGPDLSSADVDSIVADLNKMGLSFDEIVADADALAAALRKLDQVSLDNAARGGQKVEESMQGARSGLAGMRSESDQTKSVLANMVGNSAQDLGQLGSVAGTVGVGIGQLAEYATEGGIAIGQLAQLAPALLGVAAAGQLISTAMQSIQKHAEAVKETKAFDVERVDAFVEALKDGVVKAGELEDVLRGAADTGIFVRWRDDTVNVDKAVSRFFKTFTDFKKVVDKGMPGFDEFVDKQIAAGKAAGMNSVQLYQLKTVLGDVRDGTISGTSAATAMANGWTDMVETALALANAIGTQGDAFDKSAFNAQFYGKVLDENADKQDKADKATLAAGDALEKWANDFADAVQSFNDSVMNVDQGQQAIDDLAGSFSQMGIALDALGAVFHLGNRPIEFLGEITDIHDAMRDLSTFIQKDLKGKIPNIFDPNDVNAGAFLDKISSLRGPIQQQIEDAFSTGGAPAATLTANNFVDQLFAVLKGSLSKGQIRELIGVTDLDVKLHAAVDQEDLQKAQKELDILTGVTGANAWTATVALALEQGTISPQAAKILIERQLELADIEVPAKLATPDTGPAKAEADAWAADPRHSVNILTMMQAASPESKVAAHKDGQDFADRNTIHFPSVIDPPRQAVTDYFRRIFQDAGGITGPAGGIVAEKGPEILNSRYLALHPTVVPPGTRVTSRARTARILKVRGTRGLRPYDQGGIVAGPRHVNVTVNAGVVGNRFDVMRAITKGERDADRLLGVRR